MTLLQSIVGELDRELARLRDLRELVAELGQMLAVVAQISSSPVMAPTSSESVLAAVLPLAQAAKPARRTRADAGKPRGRRTPKSSSPAEPRALSRSVPSGPVVFTASQLAEEKAKCEQAKESQVTAAPDTSLEDLDALGRSLSARWSTGLVQ